MKFIKPMLAKLSNQSEHDLNLKNVYYEPKLDGYRALCYYRNDKVNLYSRNRINITKKFPELNLKRSIHAKNCILDGELVVYDKKGIPKFELMQGRSQIEDQAVIKHNSKNNPAVYVVFDILYCNGKSLLKTPLQERKKILEEHVSDSDSVEVIPFFKTSLRLWKDVLKHKLEGIIAKKIMSAYQPNARNRDWVKIKLSDTADCIIVGFTQENRLISSLVLAMYNIKKELKFVGKVGTGFDSQQQRLLYNKFEKIISKTPTLKNFRLKDVIWLKPKFVAEIKYLEWTSNKRLRTPVFIRLKNDKNLKDCNQIPF